MSNHVLGLCRLLIRLLEREERRTRDHRDTQVLVQGRKLMAIIETRLDGQGPKENA